jgi:hypothetical protein
VEQVEYLHEILDEESGSEYSSDSDNEFDDDYTQLVTPGTHMISESDNDETQDEIVEVELGDVSRDFLWEDINSFPASRVTFCDVHGPQFDTTELDVVSAFENIFDNALVQHIVDETNKYAQQEIAKSVRPLTFRSRIRSGKMSQCTKCTWFWL